MPVIVILISIVGGLFIGLFFRLIRYRDEANKRPPVPKYRSYQNYLTVSEFVAGGHKRWWKYILFRSLPPFIVFILLVSIYQKYDLIKDTLYPLILTSLIFLLPKDLYCLTKRSVTLPEKIMHLINVGAVLIVVVFTNYLTQVVPIDVLAPSMEGVIDNLWASLLVASLVIFYLDATNLADKEEMGKENARSNYVVTTYRRLNEKFGESIVKECQKLGCSAALLYAILIYENMNRPSLVRKLENLFVRFFPIELTLGIAQVKSRRPLTDEESILIAIQRLKGSNELIKHIFQSDDEKHLEVRKIISPYNSNKDYSDSIIQILGILNIYAPETF